MTPTDAAWVDFGDGYVSGYEEGHGAGYRAGYTAAHERALTEWVDTLRTEPRTPFIPTQRKPSTSSIYKTKPQTPQQILAQARWSWAQVERQIAEQTEGAVA